MRNPENVLISLTKHSNQKITSSDIYMEDKGYWTDRIDLLAPAPELPLKKNCLK